MSYQQLDFGGFDPLFPGITVKFNNTTNLAHFQKSQALGASDQASYYESISTDQREQALFAMSALSHEYRHFHDFLVSSYGTRLFKLRLDTILNTSQILPHIIGHECGMLPIPLTDWCALPVGRRRECVEYGRAIGVLPNDRPVLALEWPRIDASLEFHEMAKQYKGATPSGMASLRPILEATVATLRRIAEIWVDKTLPFDDSPFQPWQVMELSAVVCQIQEVWTRFGEEAANRFANALMADSQSPYARAYRAGSLAFTSKGGFADSRVLSTATTWALLGDHTVDQWKSCPMHRFASIWQDLHKYTEKIECDDDVRRCFAEWSENSGLSTVEQGLKLTRQMYEQAIQNIMKLIEHCGGTQYEQLAEIVTALDQASQRLSHRLLTDPLSYVGCDRYCTLDPKELPHPVTRVKLEDGLAIKVHREVIAQRHLDIEHAYEMSGDNTGHVAVTSYFVRLSEGLTQTVSGHLANYFETCSALCDYLFFPVEHRSGAESEQLARHFLGLAEIYPFEFRSLSRAIV